MYQPYFLKRTALDNQRLATELFYIDLWFFADG